jgi:hypothetical protein
MPVTRSSSFGPKEVDAARTLLRFHYDMKALATTTVAPRRDHTMSLRGHGTTVSKRQANSTRPRRQCSSYTPGMYTEED